MHVPNLIVHLYHLSSPTHRKAAKERKKDYQRQFDLHKEENIKRVRRMSQLRGEPSVDFLYDSAWGTGAASRARSRSVHDVGAHPAYAAQDDRSTAPRTQGSARPRPFSMIYDNTSAFPGAGYGSTEPVPPLPSRMGTNDGYMSGGSGGSGYDSGLSGISGNSFEARRPGSIAPSLVGGSGATSRSTSGGIEMSGGLGSGAGSALDAGALPSPPRYVDVATPVRLSRERPRPISLIGGKEVPGFWKRGSSRSRSRGRGRRKKADEWWDANGPGREEELGRFVQVVDRQQGERELRMSAMVN
ncbi:Hypothetical protein D9617_26g078700 [Elsinoe fawcettii]|nr:Hypothetical protein D9617_26g078700 [Elsinoe fawcettii]